MAYKEKTCPTCSITHTKRGPYCSRSCGNSRPMPEHQKQTMSAVKREWAHNTDQGEESRWRLNNHDEPEPVAPLHHSPLKVNQFIDADGDLWTEN